MSTLEEILATFPAPTFAPGAWPTTGTGAPDRERRRLFRARQRQERQRLARRQQQHQPTTPLLQQLQTDAKNYVMTCFDTIEPWIFSNLKNVPMNVQIHESLCLSKCLTGRLAYLTKLKESLKIGTPKEQRAAKKFLDTIKSSMTMPFQDVYQEVYDWFMKERRVLVAMFAVVALQIQKKYKDRILNTDDPCTLCPPEQPVKVFNVKSRGVYQFEAKSIRRHIDSLLTEHDWLFPIARQPTNPLTNIPFTIGELQVIHKQLRAYGESSWALEGFASCQYICERFRTEFYTPLKLEALKDAFKNPTADWSIEAIQDFIEEQMEMHKVRNRNTRSVLQWAVEKEPNHPYMLQWRQAWFEFTRNILIFGSTYYTDRPTVAALFQDKTKALLLNNRMVAELAEKRLATLPPRRTLVAEPQLPLNYLVGANPLLGPPTNLRITVTDMDTILMRLVEDLYAHHPPTN